MKSFMTSIVTAAAVLAGSGLVDSNLNPAAATGAMAEEARWFGPVQRVYRSERGWHLSVGPFQCEREAIEFAYRLRREGWGIRRVYRNERGWHVEAFSRRHP